MTICLNCNTFTKNNKFCSRSCSASYNNKISPKRKLKKKCTECDLQVKSYRHSKCEHHWALSKETKYKSKTIGEYRNLKSVLGKHPSWTNSHVRLFAKSWNKHLTKLPCAHCGYDKHVELAHIKPVSEFEDNALLSEINSENNIIPLCPNCHWEFDNLHRN